MKRLRKRLKHFFVAHRGNRYKPGLFARQTVSVIALILLLIEGVYLFHTNIVLKNEGFLASVLPAALTTLTNGDRTAQGLPTLTEDPDLDKIAQAKADDMAAKGYFAHVSPDGKTPWDFLNDAGYPYTYAGENLAEDFSDSEDVERAWMNSPLHRANILKQQYTRVGIGVSQGIYEGKEVTFVAQYFATKVGDGAAVAAGSDTNPAVAAASAPATTPVETTRPAAQVLGAATSGDDSNVAASPVPVPAPENTAAVLATSPRSVVWYIGMIFTAFIAFLFALTLFVHQRRRRFEIEVIGGGLALIAVALLIVYYNGSIASGVQLPADQTASVAQAL